MCLLIQDLLEKWKIWKTSLLQFKSCHRQQLDTKFIKILRSRSFANSPSFFSLRIVLWAHDGIASFSWGYQTINHRIYPTKTYAGLRLILGTSVDNRRGRLVDLILYPNNKKKSVKEHSYYFHFSFKLTPTRASSVFLDDRKLNAKKFSKAKSDTSVQRWSFDGLLSNLILVIARTSECRAEASHNMSGFGSTRVARLYRTFNIIKHYQSSI